MARQYTVFLVQEPEEGGYSVQVPSLPGCVTQGETLEKCAKNAKEAIALLIESLEAHGEQVPEEREQPTIITSSVAA